MLSNDKSKPNPKPHKTVPDKPSSLPPDATTKANPKLQETVPYKPSSPLGESGEISILEEIKLVVALAAPARAQANKDKSAFELTQQVSELSEVVHDRRKAKNERRVLLVTAAKMRDEQNDFGPPQPNKRKKKKVAQLITRDLWFRRLDKYPGDKLDLLMDFAFADEVPVEDLLKQLFERADISRLDQMKDLLHYAGAGWGRRCFSSVATFLVESEPERELLLTAIEKGDGVMCSKWLLKLGYDDILLQLPFLDL